MNTTLIFTPELTAFLKKKHINNQVYRFVILMIMILMILNDLPNLQTYDAPIELIKVITMPTFIGVIILILMLKKPSYKKIEARLPEVTRVIAKNNNKGFRIELYFTEKKRYWIQVKNLDELKFVINELKMQIPNANFELDEWNL